MGAKENSVIGAWADGAENSTMMVADKVSHDALIANAAMKGHLRGRFADDNPRSMSLRIASDLDAAPFSTDHWSTARISLSGIRTP